MQIPCSLHRTNHVISPLDYSCRNMSYLVYIVKDMGIRREEPTIHKVVTGI